MNTGICKTLILWLTVATLSACSDGADLGFLQGGGPVSKQRAPLTQAQMMQGAVTLAPSSGYCIDPSSLRQSFALLARCDTLGGKHGALDAPLGVMTVSLAPSSGAALTLDAVVNAAQGTKIVERFDKQGLEIARATALEAEAGMSKTHWRAVTQINQIDLSIALIAPAESAAIGGYGREMIAAMVTASHDASIATSVAAEIPSNGAKKKKGLGAALTGLFE